MKVVRWKPPRSWRTLLVVTPDREQAEAWRKRHHILASQVRVLSDPGQVPGVQANAPMLVVLPGAQAETVTAVRGRYKRLSSIAPEQHGVLWTFAVPTVWQRILVRAGIR